MPIYEKSTRVLMHDWAKQFLTKGETFERSRVYEWFAANYPKIKQSTLAAHMGGMSVNAKTRLHHPTIKAGSGHDLFWQIDAKTFRLWDEATDTAPIYPADAELALIDETEHEPIGATEFAREQDLQLYLTRNLPTIEEGLTLYEDEGLKGIEFDVGGKRIDILAVDNDGAFVVIELKVGKGPYYAVGQLLRYIGWVEENMEPTKPVRGMIIANQITEDIRLATRRLTGVQLVEYEISFSLRVVHGEAARN